jgi:hypothetical protein
LEAAPKAGRFCFYASYFHFWSKVQAWPEGKPDSLYVRFFAAEANAKIFVKHNL